MVLDLEPRLSLQQTARVLTQARTKAWREQSAPQDYNTQRGIRGYESFLPPFLGKTVLGVVDEKSRRDSRLSVLDLGCGAAIFLKELRNLYPDASLSGISAFNYRIFMPYYLKPPTDIDYRVGDLHRLKRVFEGERFDVITSVFSQMYLADPLSVLKQAYHLLNPGGIAFMHQPGFTLNYEQAIALKRYWHEKGILVCFDKLTYKRHPKEPVFVDIAVQKNAEVQHLPLPFRYNKPDSSLAEKYTFTLH